MQCILTIFIPSTLSYAPIVTLPSSQQAPLLLYVCIYVCMHVCLCVCAACVCVHMEARGQPVISWGSLTLFFLRQDLSIRHGIW